MAALGEEALQAQRRHERTGRPLGSTAFVERLEGVLGRPLKKRKSGPKTAAELTEMFGWCRKVGGKLENWRKLLIVKHSERRCAAAERSLRHETSYGIDVAQSIFR